MVQWIMMELKSDAWQVLKHGPVYADWDTGVPVRVWVIDHEAYAYAAIAVLPCDERLGLIWALVEADCVSRSGSGVSVDFRGRGATGWYPRGSASFMEPCEVSN